MIDNKEKTSVLFVCMGNICRSPTAEGVFRHYVVEAGLSDRINIDSAGTHAYHVGKVPDRRATAAADGRGFSLTGIKARRVCEADFEEFDYVVAMDEDNKQELLAISPQQHRNKVSLFLSFATTDFAEVPDPYYGGAAGFERVLDLVEEASRGLLETLSNKQ